MVQWIPWVLDPWSPFLSLKSADTHRGDQQRSWELEGLPLQSSQDATAAVQVTARLPLAGHLVGLLSLTVFHPAAFSWYWSPNQRAYGRAHGWGRHGSLQLQIINQREQILHDSPVASTFLKL